MEVLLALAREPGQVISRHALEHAVWPGRVVTDDALTNAVGKLRKALNDSSRHPELIETIAKRGYRLKVAPVAAPAGRAVPDSIPTPPGQTRDRERRRSRARQWLLVLIGALVLVALFGVIAVWSWRAPRAPSESAYEAPAHEVAASVAVVPFDVLGDDAAQAYFAEGITLDLITELARIPGLLVMAPGTVFSYRDTAADDEAIAAELGVRYLIRGAVQRIGDRIRITVRLLEADRGQTLWAERFAGRTSSLFQIQDEVVEGIARGLPVRLALAQPAAERAGATDSIAAYEEFLRGRERYGRLTPEDNRIAQEHFERAISLDPDFARAHAGLALTWSRLAVDGWTEEPQAALSRAKAYAEQAAAINASVPQIHFVRAQVELFRGRHDAAAVAAMAALHLDPNYADAYALLAWILHYAGRPDQAGPALDEALKRNPRASAPYRQIAGEIAFATGRYLKAAREFAAALERNPAHTRARLWFALTLARLGRKDDAAWEAQELLALNPDFSQSRLLLAFPLKDPQQREALLEAMGGLGLPP